MSSVRQLSDSNIISILVLYSLLVEENMVRTVRRQWKGGVRWKSLDGKVSVESRQVHGKGKSTSSIISMLTDGRKHDEVTVKVWKGRA